MHVSLIVNNSFYILITSDFTHCSRWGSLRFIVGQVRVPESVYEAHQITRYTSSCKNSGCYGHSQFFWYPRDSEVFWHESWYVCMSFQKTLKGITYSQKCCFRFGLHSFCSKYYIQNFIHFCFFCFISLVSQNQHLLLLIFGGWGVYASLYS